MVSGTEEPAAHGEAKTPEVVKNLQEDTPPHQPVVMDEEDDMYEDVSDAGEVFIRRAVAQPPRGRIHNLPPPGPSVVSTSPPPIKPEMYDGTTDWSEYQIYFDHLAELFGWNEERRAQ